MEKVGRGMPRVLLVVLAFATLYGCAQADTRVEKQEHTAGLEKTQENKAGVEETQRQTGQEQEADLPAYEVTGNQGCTEGGIPGKCLYVSTEATSRKDFRALTKHLREENPEAKAVMITFLPNKLVKRESGLGAWFATKEAARAFLGPEVTDSQIQSIMDEGGFLVGRVGRGVGRRSSGETTESSAY